jgi:hypothetical protein
MAILKNTAILAMAFAALLVLSSAAPLKVQQQRSRRLANEADLLSSVSTGLGVLHNLSVSIPTTAVKATVLLSPGHGMHKCIRCILIHTYFMMMCFLMQVHELMVHLNITANITRAQKIADNQEFRIAMDITCDLFRAKDDLIPSISNSTSVAFVVKTLNIANLQDSCSWLSEVVQSSSIGGTFTCDAGDVNVRKVCKRWSHIQQFNTTKTKVDALPGTSNSQDCRTWAQQFTSSTEILDQLC